MPISSKKPASPAFSQPTARRDAPGQPAPALQRGEVVIAQCEHVRLSGQRCGSPALRGEKHCYFHDYNFNPRYLLHGGVPLPEDASSIQIGLTRVIRNLEAEPASSKNYALMLYALQTASANLKRVREEAAIVAEANAAEKAKGPSLLDLIKQELQLEEPPEGTCE
jgi:hypothetical protein